MIIVYPMLVSENVNKDIIPGLTKSLENYILVYNTDALIKQVNAAANSIVRVATDFSGQIAVGVASFLLSGAFISQLKGRIVKRGKNLIIKEGIGDADFDSPEKKSYDKIQKFIGASGKEFEKAGAEAMKTKSFTGGINKIETPKLNQISIEPTWVQVQTDSGTKLLGVKVVPYTIKTDSMVALLLNDASLKQLSAITKKYSRIIMQILFRAWRTLKKNLPGIQGGPITGNIKNDIFWANTDYKKDLFICLSQLDIEQTGFKHTPATLQKLNQLGWASMIFADDVNKQITFCMKEFGGVCSTIPYTHIYAALGKEHSKVYTDLLDAQKATGPFFRRKSTTRRKIFTK